MRQLLVGLCLAIVAACAQAQVPQLQLGQGEPVVNLTHRMATHAESSGAVTDPDALWAAPAGAAQVRPQERWSLAPGQRLAGRIRLQGNRERAGFVVMVPSARIDEVQVWYRHEEGDSWKGAVAGDLVPLSRWPFVGPFPGFPLLLGERPVELLVTAVNDGKLSVPVLVLPEQSFREVQTRQSQLSGLVTGLGLMVAVFSAIGVVVMRRWGYVVLLATALWALVTVMCVDGDMAIWFTPEWPAFNDASKHMAWVVMGALMVSMTVAALDPRHQSRVERGLGFGAPWVAVAYAALQAFWLPAAWREPGALAWAAAMVLVCLGMCALNALQGGRYVRLIVGAVLCHAAAAVLALVDFDLVGGLDLSAAATSVMLSAGVLLMRHALFSRERYGRDVLGRAAISANRDPLTALLSYSGFQLAYDEALLKQRAVQAHACAMLFVLPGLERSSADHGFVLTERALVRFAACLQAVLGDAWSIGRLSKTRFACITVRPMEGAALQMLATQVLARCARLTEPLDAVSEFDLRIACTDCRESAAALKDVLRRLDEAARTLEPAKRIVLL